MGAPARHEDAAQRVVENVRPRRRHHICAANSHRVASVANDSLLAVALRRRRVGCQTAINDPSPPLPPTSAAAGASPAVAPAGADAAARPAHREGRKDGSGDEAVVGVHVEAVAADGVLRRRAPKSLRHCLRCRHSKDGGQRKGFARRCRCGGPGADLVTEVEITLRHHYAVLSRGRSTTAAGAYASLLLRAVLRRALRRGHCVFVVCVSLFC